MAFKGLPDYEAKFMEHVRFKRFKGIQAGDTRFGLTEKQAGDLKEYADHIVERNRNHLKWFQEQYQCDPGPDPQASSHDGCPDYD